MPNGNPLYGRKWRVLVVLKDGTTALDVSDSDFETGQPGVGALRVTFDIQRPQYQSWYYGDISIYNLTSETEERLIEESASVIVEAGYVNGNYGQIFGGKVFQAIRDRENVVDYVLTLHCIDGMELFNNNFVKVTYNAGDDQRTHIQKICNDATTTIPIDGISETLDVKKMPRGKTYFGEPKRYLRQMTLDQKAQMWCDNEKLNISKLNDSPTGEALVITPENGLIDTPQQIDYGCVFRTLLNANLKLMNPPMLVKLDQTMVRQIKAQIGEILSPLDQDGIYRVIGVNHRGDTRGNEWYTEVAGCSSMGKMPLELATNLDEMLPCMMTNENQTPN